MILRSRSIAFFPRGPYGGPRVGGSACVGQGSRLQPGLSALGWGWLGLAWLGSGWLWACFSLDFLDLRVWVGSGLVSGFGFFHLLGFWLDLACFALISVGFGLISAGFGLASAGFGFLGPPRTS